MVAEIFSDRQKYLLDIGNLYKIIISFFRGYLPRILETLAPEGYHEGTQKIHSLLQEPRLVTYQE